MKSIINRIESQNYYCSNHYDVNINKYKGKYVTSLRFWENKGCISSIDP